MEHFGLHIFITKSRIIDIQTSTNSAHNSFLNFFEDPKYEEFLRTREATEKQDGFSTPQIVGIIIGCICAVALIILVVMLAVKLYGRRSAAPPALTTGDRYDINKRSVNYCRKLIANLP